MIYEVTSGPYYEYSTHWYIEGPDGCGATLTSALKTYVDVCNKRVATLSEVSTLATTAFLFEHGPGPLPFKRFGELHPKLDAVLSVGKKHPQYIEAKTARDDFLQARTLRNVESQDYYARQHAFVAEHLKNKTSEIGPVPEVESFLPPGFRIVENVVEEINFDYIPNE